MNRGRTLVIRTPEGIVFPLVIGNPIRRMIAYVIDKLVVILLSAVVALLFAAVGLMSMDIMGAAVAVGQFVVQLGYGIAMEWFWKGRTIGKRAMRLQVMDSQGLRLQFSQVVVRNLLRIVDALPAFYFIGGLTSVLSSRGQRLGDLLANTIVVYHPCVREPDLEQALPDKFNSFRNHPHLVARLRQRVSPTEAGVALSALLRRDQFESGARIELFEKIRAAFESHVRFPDTVTDGLSDEQYIRNIVDVLYR